MPKRSQRHQTEDLSRHKFALSLPKHWVYRDKDKDYGIDGEVEIFTSDGKPTGLFFLVQLKATTSNKEYTIYHVNIKLDTLDYYSIIPIPVLIVRYSESKDLLLAKWANEIDPFHAKKDVKTISIKYNKNDNLTDKSYINIEKFLKHRAHIQREGIHLPINIQLTSKDDFIENKSSNLFIHEIEENLKEYSKILSTPNKDTHHATVEISNETIAINIIGFAHFVYDNAKPIFESSKKHALEKHLLLGIALGLLNSGFLETAAGIIFSNDIQNVFIDYPQLFYRFIPQLISSSKGKEALSLCNHIADTTSDNNFAESITHFAILSRRTQNKQVSTEDIEEFLKKCLERGKNRDLPSMGIAHYNLGNFYRSRDKLKKAKHHYIRAQKNHPDYLERDYYWGELGGIFFELGKFTTASNLYKKAASLNTKERWRALYADALMFSGKYKRASTEFESYLKGTEEAPYEWHLKHFILQNIVKLTGVEEQKRQPDNALKYAYPDSTESNEKTFSHLSKSFDHDLLCGLAWHNIGRHYSSIGDSVNASLSFTTAGLIQRGDVESWVFATLSGFNNLLSIEIFSLILATAYEINRDAFLIELYKQIGEQWSQEAVQQISSIIEPILTQLRIQRDTAELRLHHEEGISRIVLDKS